MKTRIKTLLWTNSLVIVITFSLFALALFTKGLTHDILLESAIFLVSVKIILTTVQIKYLTAILEDKLEEIHKAILKDRE